MSFFRSYGVLVVFPSAFFYPRVFREVLSMNRCQVCGGRSRVASSSVSPGLSRVGLVRVVRGVFTRVYNGTYGSRCVSGHCRGGISSRYGSGVVASVVSTRQGVLPTFTVFVRDRAIRGLRFFFVCRGGGSSWTFFVEGVPGV